MYHTDVAARQQIKENCVLDDMNCTYSTDRQKNFCIKELFPKNVFKEINGLSRCGFLPRLQCVFENEQFLRNKK